MNAIKFGSLPHHRASGPCASVDERGFGCSVVGEHRLCVFEVAPRGVEALKVAIARKPEVYAALAAADTIDSLAEAWAEHSLKYSVTMSAYACRLWLWRLAENDDARAKQRGISESERGKFPDYDALWSRTERWLDAQESACTEPPQPPSAGASRGGDDSSAASGGTTRVDAIVAPSRASGANGNGSTRNGETSGTDPVTAAASGAGEIEAAARVAWEAYAICEGNARTFDNAYDGERDMARIIARAVVEHVRTHPFPNEGRWHNAAAYDALRAERDAAIARATEAERRVESLGEVLKREAETLVVVTEAWLDMRDLARIAMREGLAECERLRAELTASGEAYGRDTSALARQRNAHFDRATIALRWRGIFKDAARRLRWACERHTSECEDRRDQNRKLKRKCNALLRKLRATRDERQHECATAIVDASNAAWDAAVEYAQKEIADWLRYLAQVASDDAAAFERATSLPDDPCVFAAKVLDKVADKVAAGDLAREIRGASRSGQPARAGGGDGVDMPGREER